MLFAKLVLCGVRSRIATHPKRFDEVLPLIIGLELLERTAFLIADDPKNFFIHPTFIGRLELLAEPLFLVAPLFVAHAARAGLLLRGKKLSAEGEYAKRAHPTNSRGEGTGEKDL